MLFFFFFKQKTAYEIPLCDWSSDVCSSDLQLLSRGVGREAGRQSHHGLSRQGQIGRASCRERVYSGVEISVVGVSLKKKSTAAQEPHRSEVAGAGHGTDRDQV